MISITTRISSADSDNLDRVVGQKNYLNRSDAVRDYIRRGIREDMKEESEMNEKE